MRYFLVIIIKNMFYFMLYCLKHKLYFHFGCDIRKDFCYELEKVFKIVVVVACDIRTFD